MTDNPPVLKDTSIRRPISHESLVLIGILLVGAVLRGWYLRELIDAPDFASPALDSAFHDHWARGLAFGDWSLPAEHADPQIRTTPYFRPPGYPYFLALIYRIAGPSYVGPRLVQMGLGLISCILAFYLGRRLFGRAVGLLTALFMSFYWAFIYFEGELLAPSLSIFLALSLLNVLVRWTDHPTWPRGAAGGLLLGVLALVRPNVLLFAPLVLIWAWWLARRRGAARRCWPTALGFVAGTALAIAPATVRNYVVADDFVLISSNAGINLYAGNNERTDCVWPRLPGLREIIGRAGWTCFDHVRIVEGVQRAEGRPMKHSEVSAYYAGKAIDYIKAHPIRVLGLTAKKALLFWGPAEISNNKVIHADREHSRVLRHTSGFPLVVSLFVVGVISLGIDWRGREGALVQKNRATRVVEGAALILVFIATYFASFLPFFIAGRYRVVVTPFLLLFGAYGIWRVYQCLTARDWRRPAWFVPTGAALFVLASIPFVPYEPDYTWWHMLRAEAYQRRGASEAAVEEFQAAVELSPGEKVIHYNLGRNLAALNRLEEAKSRYLQAIEIDPDFAQAHTALGIIYGMQDDPESAARHYRAALRVAPRHLPARYNLGIVLAHLEQFDEAIDNLQQAAELAELHGRKDLLERINARLEAVRTAAASAENK